MSIQAARPTRRQRSRQIIRQRYHDRGWVSPYEAYRNAVAERLGPGRAVLDIGCGRTFPMAGALGETGAEVHGLDPVALAGEMPAGVTLTQGSAEAIPYPDGTFDVLCSQAVLEHLVDPLAVFRECRRVLRPGGEMVFLTANQWDYVSVFARLIPNRLHGRIVRALEGRQEHDTFPTVGKANSRRQLEKLAGQTRMELTRLDYLHQFPYTLTFSPTLVRVGIAYDRLIARVGRLNWLAGWIFGVMRRPDGAGTPA